MKLADLGVSKQQSSDWQQLAAIPDEEFERRVASVRSDPGMMTTERKEREGHGGDRKSKLRAASLIPKLKDLGVTVQQSSD